jgi:dipeptidase E
MSKRRLMLMSNSRNSDGEFLGHVRREIESHFDGVRTLLFVPYAGVTITWDAYTALVRDAFSLFGIDVLSVHEASDAVAAAKSADAIVIGGGNTFHLLANLQRMGLPQVIRERVLGGVPYLGWSAGSVVACPTLQTTNDMPISEPESFAALGLVAFQINAHFTDAHPPSFNGETRRQRLAEFVIANPNTSVVGLPEGTWIDIRGNSVVLSGSADAPIFRAGADNEIAMRGVELSGLLEH